MRLIMFDMDGTLVDSGATIFRNMVKTFEAHGLDVPSRARSASVVGLSLEHAMAELAGVDMTTATMMARTYRDEYRAMLEAEAEGAHEPLYAGVREALERLSAQDATLMGIATGKGLSGVHRILDLHGLRPHFVTLQTPDHNPSKPHPAMLQTAMVETGAEAGLTVFVGDTTHDIKTAVAAGTCSIGVTWGYHARAELDAAGADLIIEDFSQLDAAIEKVLN